MKDKCGDCQQDIAGALETESHVAPEASNVSNFWNTVNRQDNPEAWEVTQDLIRIQLGEECRDWKKKAQSCKDNAQAVASLLWSKCTQKLQEQIKDAEKAELVLKDALSMKAAVVKHAASHQPNAHPLLQVIDAVKTLFVGGNSEDENPAS